MKCWKRVLTTQGTDLSGELFIPHRHARSCEAFDDNRLMRQKRAYAKY